MPIERSRRPAVQVWVDACTGSYREAVGARSKAAVHPAHYDCPEDVASHIEEGVAALQHLWATDRIGTEAAAALLAVLQFAANTVIQDTETPLWL